jgi:ABC-type antimicrobial peptide transport system permease subunit
MVFSELTIFIASLGLFGLASFTATKRTKEIGVRKVLGSSTGNIVVLLSTDLLKPVLIATCIAIPAGYSSMKNWLNNFAYLTPLHWWIFVLAAFITIMIALFTVIFKAIKRDWQIQQPVSAQNELYPAAGLCSGRIRACMRVQVAIRDTFYRRYIE